jgi:Flp pilus assembly protein TadG
MHASRERGAAAVEFALVVPLLVAFLFGIVEGGTRYAQQSQVNHWAFLAARDLSIDPSKSATSVVTALKGSDTTTYTTSSSPSTACSVAGATSVTVTVKATKTSPTGLFGTYTLTGKGVARCEN